MSRRDEPRLVRCQVLVAVEPDLWQDSPTRVTPGWIDRMNAQMRLDGKPIDGIRVHPEDAEPTPTKITFPTTPETVRWKAGLRK